MLVSPSTRTYIGSTPRSGAPPHPPSAQVTTKYAGKAATSGNSRAFRFDAALFRAHPEFAAGPVTAHVLGPGTLLVTTALPPGGSDDDPDPVLGASLSFLEGQMRDRPQQIRALTQADVADLDTLLDGVDVSRDDVLGADFGLP